MKDAPDTAWTNTCMTEGGEIRLYEDEPIGMPETYKLMLTQLQDKILFDAYREKREPAKKLKASSLFQSLLSRV